MKFPLVVYLVIWYTTTIQTSESNYSAVESLPEHFHLINRPIEPSPNLFIINRSIAQKYWNDKKIKEWMIVVASSQTEANPAKVAPRQKRVDPVDQERNIRDEL